MKQLSIISLLAVLCLCGCEGFRYAATEAQRENAWLHERVCAAAADSATDENVSPTLCGLTELAHEQSAAFVIDYGAPNAVKHGQESGVALTPSPLRGTPPYQGESFWPLAGGELISRRSDVNAVLLQAKADSAKRPDVWVLADSAMELGIALAGLVGGVYGIRIAGYLKAAREKSKALKEIVEGNELFKQLWPEQADRFKESHRKQSPTTKQIVTRLKAG